MLTAVTDFVQDVRIKQPVPAVAGQKADVLESYSWGLVHHRIRPAPGLDDRARPGAQTTACSCSAASTTGGVKRGFVTVTLLPWPTGWESHRLATVFTATGNPPMRIWLQHSRIQ
jgi:hypothetical protein